MIKSQRTSHLGTMRPRHKLIAAGDDRELRYDGNQYQWGFQISDEEQRYQWFKLDLDPSQARGTSELARRYAADKALPPGYDVGAEKLVTDYLTALRKHAETFLKHKLPESALKSTLIEYIITSAPSKILCR